MEWTTTRHIQSTDNKTEKIDCELVLNFPVSGWNKKEKSPVLHIHYYDNKIEGGWWIDLLKTKWYKSPPSKKCDIWINYFQRHPKVTIYSSDKVGRTPYNDFTIDFCKQEAIKLLKQKLSDVLIQLP